MKIERDAGLWYAQQQHVDGAICVGIAPFRLEARYYCQELLTERTTTHAHQSSTKENAQAQPS